MSDASEGEGNYSEGEVVEEEEVSEDEDSSSENSQSMSIIMNKDQKSKAIKKENYTTPFFMTKYEKARILGVRALQISMNAPVRVSLPQETDPLEIAREELRQKKIPIKIRRYLPDGTYEDWGIEELLVDFETRIAAEEEEDDGF